MNVDLPRARRQLLFVGDLSTLCRHTFLVGLLAYVKGVDGYRPAHESVVARIESGRATPSMRTVQRFASAVGARAVVRMEPLTAGRIR